MDHLVTALPFVVAIHYPRPNFSFHSIQGVDLSLDLLVLKTITYV